MNSYPLSEEVLSPYCRGYWDNDNKKFFNVNSIDIIDCCMGLCRNHIDFCFNQCENNYREDIPNYNRCNKQCKELIDNCKSGCMEIYSNGLTITGNCAEKNNCGIYPLLNKECMENNKEAIIKCCNQNCIVNQSTDCDHDFCGDFFDRLSGKTQFDLQPRLRSGNLENTKKNSNLFFYIVIGLLLILISLFIKMKFFAKIIR